MGFFVSCASGLFDTVEERFAESLSINVRIIIFRVIDTHLSISRKRIFLCETIWKSCANNPFPEERERMMEFTQERERRGGEGRSSA